MARTAYPQGMRRATTVLAIAHPVHGGPAKAVFDLGRGREGVVPHPLRRRERSNPALDRRPAAQQLAAHLRREVEIERGVGRPWLKALRTEEHLYVEYETGECELYDLKEDPYELRNLYATASSDLKRGLGWQLDALRQCSAEWCRSAEEG